MLHMIGGLPKTAMMLGILPSHFMHIYLVILLALVNHINTWRCFCVSSLHLICCGTTVLIHFTFIQSTHWDLIFICNLLLWNYLKISYWHSFFEVDLILNFHKCITFPISTAIRTRTAIWAVCICISIWLFRYLFCWYKFHHLISSVYKSCFYSSIYKILVFKINYKNIEEWPYFHLIR